MIEESKLNFINYIQTYHIYYAFNKWLENQDKSFLYCWKETLRENPITQYDLDHNEVKVEPREYLKITLETLKASVEAQIFCYAFEFLLNNYESSLSLNKQEFNQLKDKILIAPKNFNNDQLLNFIRNAISHNDDLDISLSYSYDRVNQTFTFLPTKKKQNSNSIKITMSQKELFDLLTIYANNFIRQDNEHFVLDIDMNKVKYKASIMKAVNDMHLRREGSNNIIYPDDNQKKVLYQMVEQIRNGKIVEGESLSLYYPFKQNCRMNFVKFLNFYTLIGDLYNLRSLDYSSYIEEVMKKSPTRILEIKNSLDIENLFITNQFFQIFSTSPNNMIQSKFDKLAQHIKFGKLRNSIMHGTFFFDFKGNLFTYDAPRGEKTEEQLKFVDSFDHQFLSELTQMFMLAKVKNINEAETSNQQ